MARPPITAKGEGLFRRQLEAALDWLEANSGGGGGGPTDLGYNAATRLLTSSTGADVTLPLVGANPGLMAAADKTKLDGIAAGATVNATDAALRDRATHTGTQAQSTITGLVSDLAAKQATLVSGTNIRTVNGNSLLGSGDVVVSGSVPDVLELEAQTTTPAPLAGHLKLFAAARANRIVLRQVGPAGVDVSLQPALFGNTIRMWHASGGTAVGVMGQAGLTAINTGTGAAVRTPTIAATSNIAGISRFILGTGTVAGNTSGVRDPAAYYFRGNAAGRGGWFYHCRFAVEVSNADIQVQIGMAVLATALAGDPSAFLNCAMIGKDAADANWQFMHNDGAGAATKVNTGQAVADGDIFDFFMFAPPNGTTIDFQLNNALTGATIATHQATTDLPVGTVILFNRASIRAPSSTTARQLAINKVYTETDL